MANVQVKVSPRHAIHIDWKAVLGVTAFVCTLIVQQVPQFLNLPAVQNQPEEVKILTFVVQVASGLLLLFSKFGLLPIAESVAQDAAGQLNARPPAPAPSATTSTPTEEGK